jgi:hypothetical protein
VDTVEVDVEVDVAVATLVVVVLGTAPVWALVVLVPGAGVTGNGVAPAKSAANVSDSGPTTAGSLVVRPSSRL